MAALTRFITSSSRILDTRFLQSPNPKLELEAKIERATHSRNRSLLLDIFQWGENNVVGGVFGLNFGEKTVNWDNVGRSSEEFCGSRRSVEEVGSEAGGL